jgi:hypothetical protein
MLVQKHSRNLFFNKLYETKFRFFREAWKTKREIKRNRAWSWERAEKDDFKAGESFELGRRGFAGSAGTNAEAPAGSDWSDNQSMKGESLRRYLEEPGGLFRSFMSAELFIRKSVWLEVEELRLYFS